MYYSFITPRVLVLTLGMVMLSSCGGELLLTDPQSQSSVSISTSASSKPSSSSSPSASSSSSGFSTAEGNDYKCIGETLSTGYCLVWSDEFNSCQLDPNKWRHQVNCLGGYNGERQCYTKSASNTWVDGDLLHIKAIKEPVSGPAKFDEDPSYDPNDVSVTREYSSALIRTKHLADFKYGRLEMRAKLPYGQGAWPAFWMLPTDEAYGTWAASGEIDIMEAVNLKVGGESRTQSALHYGGSYPQNVTSFKTYQLPNGNNPADDFHLYAVEWEQGEIRFYVDGEHFLTQRSSGWYSASALTDPFAPFNQRFYLILNLAVGGKWPESVNNKGVDASIFPQEMQVDYVRVYQCTKNPTTGLGCATTGNNFTLNPGHKRPSSPEVGGDSVPVFNGLPVSPYYWATYTAAGSIDYTSVDAGGNYGLVGQITYNTDQGVGYFQSPSLVNLNAFNYIEFDLRVTADSRAVKSNLIFRADCNYPCTSGERDIGYPSALNVWQHYKIPLAELAATGLDKTQVNTPFTLYTSWNNQKGLTLQVDNLVVTK